MTRPVTLCTGPWADLPLEELARKSSEFGYDGLELACWGDLSAAARALPVPATWAKNRQWRGGPG